MKTSLQFINHASVIISDGKTSVLSDPWYAGEVFHKGWNLLHENSSEEISEILDGITHIWVSHEHPDHFSVPFFKLFAQKIKALSIIILFQKTKDKRVVKFLTEQGFDVHELEFNQPKFLNDDFSVTCIKDGFYDSGLLIEVSGEKILNLNDCEVTTEHRANEVFSVTGEVDVLLTQFSFAAWKGGKENKRWRDDAADQKINAVRIQIDKFHPKLVIPFASFVYFSNAENFYLNDAVNKPRDVVDKIGHYAKKILIMAPYDKIGGDYDVINNENAIIFWDRKYSEAKPIQKYHRIEMDQLIETFGQYCDRIHKNNNINLIKILRKVKPIGVFTPCLVHLSDLNVTVKFDYVFKSFRETHEDALISMQSESLYFIFKNSFGFDTLTVNGCFEEVAKNGFVRATKTLAIENLNNLGINIEINTLFNFPLIKLFLERLYRVARKLDV